MRKSWNGCRVLRKGCNDGAPYGPACSGSRAPRRRPTPPPSSPSSMAVPDSSTSSTPAPNTSALPYSGRCCLRLVAIKAMLKGAPIVQISSDSDAGAIPAFKAHDIRHVSKNLSAGDVPRDLHKVARKSRTRLKRSAGSLVALVVSKPGLFLWAASHETEEEDNREDGSAFSAVTAEGSNVIQGEPDGVRLDLRLGLELESQTEGRGAEAKVRSASPADGRPVGPRLRSAA
ncbi:hypothetical protein OPV22_009163 [Ensete ventricosum]|uniref:Uncharacterized protein n=1 Tax=Ensete ventricosum TaxID=4639 RepID=A0AAV8RHU6_ENSVE|nr:hypothetical protein OPV22_009163 [Ensete ventricosum]